MMHPARILKGILGVLQTPFLADGGIDFPSHRRLIVDALEAGADGFLVPALASENGSLSREEKLALAHHAQEVVEGRAPLIWGAGSIDPEECAVMGNAAEAAGGSGLLVAVPPALYPTPEKILEFFRDVAGRTSIPLMIQDWEPGGSGMTIETILNLCKEIPTFRYLKVETLPAGPKYTEVLEATGGELHVSGGWAVPQMIEALDRGVHAMIPESSMVRVYKAIDRLHRSGDRDHARDLFNRLVPILAFTNQELDTSIRFFKRLLVRKGIFQTATTRLKSREFDAVSEQIAEELVDHYLRLESEVGKTIRTTAC